MERPVSAPWRRRSARRPPGGQRHTVRNNKSWWITSFKKSFCRRTCLREARAIAERTRRPGETGLPARSVRAPRPGQRSAGAARLPGYAALASGPARVVLISTRALSSLSFSKHQPPGIDEGDAGDADEAEDVPDI